MKSSRLSLSKRKRNERRALSQKSQAKEEKETVAKKLCPASPSSKDGHQQLQSVVQRKPLSDEASTDQGESILKVGIFTPVIQEGNTVAKDNDIIEILSSDDEGDKCEQKVSAGSFSKNKSDRSDMRPTKDERKFEKSKHDATSAIEIDSSDGESSSVEVGDNEAATTGFNDNFSAPVEHETQQSASEENSNCQGVISSKNEDNCSATNSKHLLYYRESAYVQNLAEICHDIMHDARWRTSSKRLLQWEYGDDLGAVQSFSRIFINPSTISADTNKKEDKNDNDIQKEDQSENGIDGGCDIYARCMHLYARLFHRKGPWFNIVDVFIRYYQRDYERRRKVFEQRETSENGEDPINDGSAANDDPVHTISWNIIQEGLHDCISDLHQLKQMGLLRSFLSEEECGRVVGSPESKLLTAKDKLRVLQKLGGNTKKRASPKSGATSDQDIKRDSFRSSPVLKNDILKQMKSQRTMMFRESATGDNLLPVQKHVNNMLIEALSYKIKLLIGETTRRSMGYVKTSCPLSAQDIKRIWKSISPDKDNSFITCFRLREEPLLALRRTCRLMLCAGEGPGSMRWSGANSWMTVVEREESGSAEKIMEERKALKGICKLPEPPTTSAWNQVSFPGLQHRMGIDFFHFSENYSRCPVGNNRSQMPVYLKSIELFNNRGLFLSWEAAAELRGVVDYLNEWNRLILYSDRKLKSAGGTKDLQLSPRLDNLEPRLWDSFRVLSTVDRRELCTLLLHRCDENQPSMTDTLERIEESIISLHLESSGENEDSFLTDAERMICSIGIVCQQVLLHRFEYISVIDIQSLVKRPWLRHLHFESVLAYIVWDCIDLLEKRKYHKLASQMLETILFGSTDVTSTSICGDHQKDLRNFVQLLLSRRVRGKAFVRLLIDKKHCIQQKNKDMKKRGKKSQTKPHPVDSFTTSNLPDIASTGALPFSFIRKLSRRIKLSLTQALANLCSLEVLELGIRLESQEVDKSRRKKDWEPIIDSSIANSISHETRTGSGKRCAYVSSEDNDDNLEHTRSLNVEELAIEEYASGRLPVEASGDSHLNDICVQHIGGWKGWHGEGVHVRALYRILCTNVLLGCRFDDENVGDLARCEELTTFLHAYQTAPLDLHVAHGVLKGEKLSTVTIRSFYERRRKCLDQFLSNVQAMSPQDVSDLVYDSILGRMNAVKATGKRMINNQLLCRDLKETRTLSMLGEACLIISFPLW